MKALDHLDEMRGAWSVISPDLSGYDLVLPGSPSFVCRAEACSAHCCKAFSVSVGDREVERMAAESGLQPVEFLELEGGEPITLPLAKPMLLARAEGNCALLGDDLRCTQYHARPDACRLYPHFVIGFDPATAGARWGAADEVWEAARAFVAGGYMELMPLLVRHMECPGFTGPPLGEEARALLLESTARLAAQEAGGP